MEILLRVFSVLVRSGLPFFNAALPSNADLGAAISLHLLQAVTAGTDEQTEEVDLGEFLDGDIDLLRRAVRTFLLLIFDRGSEVGIILHGTVD